VGALSDQSSAGDVSAYLVYVIASVEADAAVAHHAPLVHEPWAALEKDKAARIAADNLRIKAVVKTNFAFNAMADTLEAFSLATGAHYGSKTHPGYLRIFAYTPAQYGTLPKRDQGKAMADLDAAIADDATPAEVKKAAKPFQAARAAWLAAQADEAKVTAAFKKADEKTFASKKACLNGVARLRGRLMDQFPRQGKKVARYFPVTKGKSKAKAVVVPLVAAKDDEVRAG